MKAVSQREFHAAAKRGRVGNVAVVRPSSMKVRTADGESRVRTWRFSDGGIDRMFDRIAPDGWETANYMRAGGPVLFGHNAEAPPIGRTISLRSDAIALTGDIAFASAAESDFADTVFRLVAAGYMKAGSVGFLPLQWRWADDPDRPGGINFLRQELLEFSIVPVPALPTALVEARGIGIDTRPMARWAELALDTGGGLIERRTLLELRTAAREPPRLRSGDRNADLLRAAAIRRRVDGPSRDDRTAQLQRAQEIANRVNPYRAGDQAAAARAEQERAERQRYAAAQAWAARSVGWW